MTKATIEKLDEAVKAVRALPDEAQAVIAHELMERVTDFSNSSMTDEQRMEVKRRLAKPRMYVSDAKVRTVLRRYNAVL